MGTHEYSEHYGDGHLRSITFAPDWSGSKGFTNTTLGQALFRRSPFPGFSLRKDGILQYTVYWDRDSDEPVINCFNLVADCQERIHEMMDEAYHQLRIAQAIAEAHAEGICV